jgi:hypothetical protein
MKAGYRDKMHLSFGWALLAGGRRAVGCGIGLRNTVEMCVTATARESQNTKVTCLKMNHYRRK